MCLYARPFEHLGLDSNNGTAATAAATATTDNDEGQPRSAPVTSRSPGGPAATEPPATV
ncbi:hypothetical protein PTSG_11854 [Salpingoeca rosetta]|uniref:Uncharacterized protein n=1 Tax=Salpingoeca rosetta (strain ATCC 50818 / BSB-021) TaxID=946362 RepID=F2U1L7_SALR5|nr:uncharacterized protein PTSG_11854 [Salpingoeca rosetta]EGD81519.1 hypothetical protein PTSG_11854 [Salpingoeca rosetta]|eukprot:XP_004996723.1 hypothetical protein PTSG_11854 [Salpingoeca rosetta]